MDKPTPSVGQLVRFIDDNGTDVSAKVVGVQDANTVDLEVDHPGQSQANPERKVAVPFSTAGGRRTWHHAKEPTK